MIERERRSSKRVTLTQKNSVSLVSIGSDVKYSFKTRNISNQGLFLEYKTPENLPFTSSSLVEAWLTLDEGETIFFNAKVVRVVLAHDNQASLWGPGIAIKIVQISDNSHLKLEKFIQRVAGDSED